MQKKNTHYQRPYLFFPLSVISNIILPYLFPQIGIRHQDSSIHYLSKCVKIILQTFHFKRAHIQVLTDFIRVYSKQKHVDVFQTSQFLSQVVSVQSFQQLTKIADQFEDFIDDSWILPLTELLIEQKADVTENNNWTLRWASYLGHTSTVELLLDRKADIGVDENYSLRWASQNGYISTVALLLDRKADIGAQDNAALLWASDCGNTSIVELLLDRKADICAQQHSALRWASYNGHTSTVELLLDRKAEVNAVKNFALRFAIKNGHTSTVQLLLDRKAQVS